MLHQIISISFYCLLQFATSAAASSNSNRKLGSFEDPPAIVRPRFRYWLPDSSVDPDVVKTNIKAVGALGAGGVEFLSFFDYGGSRGGPPPGSDWSRYDFGTPAFKDLFKAALEAHREAGLSMDFALGPNQGQGVPASANDEGLQWDLVPFSAPVPSDGAFNATLPGWGAGELVAVVFAVVLSETNVSASATGPTYSRLVLKHGSLTDISDQVSTSTGSISTQFPRSNSTDSFRLFSFYQKHTYNHNIVAPKNITKTIFDNGSFTVDHFDARGALTVTNFWEREILTGGLRELLSEVGDCSWEDSMELLSNVSWSPSLPARFERKLGYNMKSFLPLIMFGNNNINLQRSNPGAVQCVLDTEDQGSGYVNDYRIALTDGYQEYLTTLINWTHSYLNLRHSSQVSYNLPMDMEASTPFDDIPECESLQFRDSVDGYRQFSGVAYLAGKNVVSVELGAVFGLAFRYTLPNLLFSVNRAVSGGINRVVIHGQSYTSNYTATTWPGFTTFGYRVSDSYSEKQPDWNHGLGQALDYIGRTQYIQQQGVGKLDIAFYNRQSATDPIVHTLYTSDDLRREGWTYAYLSPDNFKLPQSYVHDGVLAPDGPSFKAMVVQNTQNMTLEGVAYLQRYARAGLTILLLGGRPGYYPSKDSHDRDAIERAISNLANTTNVHSVAEGDLPQQLRLLGLAPQISVRTNDNATWYTTWREDREAGVDYAFMFNDFHPASGEITVASTKKPYVFNAWTGTRIPLLNYKQNNSGTIIPLSLAGNQTIIIAFTDSRPDGVETPAEHIVEMSSEVLGYNYSKSSGLSLHVAASSTPSTVQLSSGQRISLDAVTVPQAFELNNWTLIAEHWEAPSNLNDASVVAAKHNTTHHLNSLVSWADIPALANVSGLGYYENSFEWPISAKDSDSQARGAYIKFSPVLHAITLFVNGHQTPPLDYSDPVADLSAYIRHGTNQVTAIVPTTMLNYLRSIQSRLRNGGQPVTLESSVDNGLVGTVTVIPFKNVKVL